MAWKTLLVYGTGLETLLLSDLHDAAVEAAVMRSLSDRATQTRAEQKENIYNQ